MRLIAISKNQPVIFPRPMKAERSKARIRAGNYPRLNLLVRTIKLTALFILCGFMQLLAKGNGEKISLSEKNAPIEKVFNEIRKQTGYQFLYTTQIIENARKVTITVKEANLEDVLNRCFNEQPFYYEIIDNTIIVKPRPGGPVIPTSKPIEIKGRIVNEKGEPIVGASVSVKGTLVRVLTNANGEFTLPGTNEDAVLLISHVQYEDASIRVKGNSVVNAVMQIRFGSLDELQVIAYGTVTKRLNSGDVTTIKSKDLFKQPVNNPLQAMQGRVPGLMITQQTGVTGGGFNVLIRGRNSIINGNDPLYVIDGVPYASQLVTNDGSISTALAFGRTNPSPLNFINVSDIESIDVLKDADATAIYGTRAANGVILITTKKGKAGKTAVDVNVYSGVANVAHMMKLLNTNQYLEYRNEAFANDGAAPGPLDNDLNGPWNQNQNTDWQKKLIGGNARLSDAQASVSGGNADIQYMINGGYHKETTIYPGDFGNNKASLHFNLNTTSVNKKFKVLLSGSYVSGYNHLPYSDFMTETKTYPNAPDVYDAKGNLNWANNTWNNPYSRMQVASKVYSKNLLGNSTLSYELMPGLEIKTSLGYSNLQYNDVEAFPTTYFRPNLNQTTGNTNFSFNTLQSWIVEPQVKYKFSVSDGRFDILVGSTIQQNQNDGNTIAATGYTDNSLLESMAAASAINKGTIVNTLYKYNALFARVNYNWQDKYIVNLTGRRDGSSRFGPEKQFNNFGAAGVAWIFSNENFIMNALPALSFGKIRASYGTTGSDQVGDYRFLDIYTYSNFSAPYQTTPGLYPSNLFNPALAWEVNKKAEVGLEIGLLKDRIFFTASYFRNRSGNQLVSSPLPNITGFSKIDENLPATVQNAGWEFAARTFNLKTKNVSWISSFNFTLQKNKLISFPNLEESSYANKFVVGEPITVIEAYHSIGVNPQTGLYSFLAADGSITSSPNTTSNVDRFIRLNPDPRFFGGLQNTITFKNFDIDFFFLFVKQIAPNPLFLNAGIQPGLFSRFTPLNWSVEIMNNRWQKPGDIATVQKFTRITGAASDAYTAASLSDYGYADASYIRLKNISVSYRLPEVWLRKMHCQNVRIYLQGQNLFTITRYKGMDPEAQNIAALPPLRVFTGGIQLSL